MPGPRSVLAFFFLLSFSTLGSAQSGWSLQGFMPPGAEEGTAAVWCPTRQSILVVSAERIFEGGAGAWSVLSSGLGYAQCRSDLLPVAYWNSANDALVLVSADQSSGYRFRIRSWNPAQGFRGDSYVTDSQQAFPSAAFYDQRGSRGVVILTDGRILEIPDVGTPSLVSPPTRPFLNGWSSSFGDGSSLRSAALDVHRRCIVVVVGAPSELIYEYDLASGFWLQGPALPPAYGPRGASTVGYDALRRVTVIFGGWPADQYGSAQWHLAPLSDVWHYEIGRAHV